MKLLKLHIQNFQSHKNTVITFTAGLNVIVGPTDTGKSAILRTLRKLIRDEPSGKHFISKWANSMTITLVFEKAHIEYTVCRKITPSKNLYYLNNEEYGGFGKVVPQEIRDALDMVLVELETGDELDLHFSDQHDPPFMVSKGQAGTRSKLLGRITGLHVLDRAITRINSDIRAENVSLKHKDAEKCNLQYSLEDWPDLWHELKLVNTLIVRIEEVKISQLKHDSISLVHKKLLQIQEEIQRAKSRLDTTPLIRANFKELMKKIEIQQYIADVHRKLVIYHISINKLKNLVPPEINADFEGIRNRILHLDKLGGIFDKLEDITKNAGRIDKNSIIKRLAECTKEHFEILNELGICPTCKNPIGDHKHG